MAGHRPFSELRDDLYARSPESKKRVEEEVARLRAEIGSDEWWKAGANFRWCLPRFNLYTPADKTPRVLLNRYPHNVIGAAVVIFGRCWCLNWKRS